MQILFVMTQDKDLNNAGEIYMRILLTRTGDIDSKSHRREIQADTAHRDLRDRF
jgi:hypothetical protein